MGHSSKKIDWSEERWRQGLTSARKFLWLEDTVGKLAAWLRLRPGMTAVDVGCGWGYLGRTYWPYFGEGGHYIGLEESPKLLREAAKMARNWAVSGQASFVSASAEALPIPHDSADWVMCQTLLMHLEDPQVALAEMVRVTKPGGVIMCKEPDNLSTSLAKPHWSLPEYEVEEELLAAKVNILCNKGRIKLGRGDHSIGPKIPEMMRELGLTDIDARINDRVYFLEPPYQSRLQQQYLGEAKRGHHENNHQFCMHRIEEEFLAGGGKPQEYRRYREMANRSHSAIKQQIDKGDFFICGGGFFYVVKGNKPQ